MEERIVELREPGLFCRLVLAAAQAVPGPRSEQRPFSDLRGGKGKEPGLTRAGEKRAHGKSGLAKPLRGEPLSVWRRLWTRSFWAPVIERRAGSG